MFDADTMTGALVRRTRDERGMTQAALARAVGVTPAQISYLEGGGRPWSLDMITRVAIVLGVDAHDLVPRLPGRGQGDATAAPADVGAAAHPTPRRRASATAS